MEISRTYALSYPVEPRGQPGDRSPRTPTSMQPHTGSPARVASHSANAGTYAAPASTLSRIRRGGVLGTCGAQPEFRECRGGEALKEMAVSYQKFDQNDRRRTRGPRGRGTCDGLVREAMRRIDRDDSGATADVPSAVNQMLIDADSRSRASREMFERIDRFQDGLTPFALGRYVQRNAELYDGTPDRSQRIAGLMTRLHDWLQPGDMAYLRLGMTSPVDNSWQHGHALLMQRRASGDYVVFDPNNGAFVYRNEAGMARALRGYLDTAYSETGLQVMPDSIQVYARGQPRVRATQAPLAPLLPEPPPELYRHGLYARTAVDANGLSQGVLFAAAGQPRAMADSATGMAADALVNIAGGRSRDLASATADLRERLRNPQTRQAAIDGIRGLQDVNRYAMVSNLPNHVRHEGQSHIQSAAQLADDLNRHFEQPYVRDNSLRGYDDDFVEIRFTSGGNPAGSGATRTRGRPDPAEPPVIVQRINPSANYLNDAYQIYDPAVGVFSYRNFADMSSAISSRYGSADADQRDADHATTTWFANLGRSRPMHGASQDEFAVAGESSINNVTLSDIAQAHHVAVPPIALPPEPDMERLAGGRPEFRKRSLDASDGSRRGLLFRPSTLTPEALKVQGGFSIESTPLKDVSLDMHDFDVSSNPSAVDSAGYLGTFQYGRTALDRLASQSNSGYLYHVAPAPNMVDVNGSLGAGTRDPHIHEQAAMGRIDYTQIAGWQRVEDGKLQPFVANPDYRWDIYDQTQTGGAQPQLARYPVDSPVWNDGTHSPFMSHVSYGGKPAVARPEQDPNRTQAEFYDHANSQIEYLVDRQARRLDYRGPMTLWGYGDARWQTKLYVGGKGEVCFDYSRRVDVPGNTSQFVMGEDGRFHLSGDNKRVLRVDNNGYLYAGSVPSTRTNRNGVFEFDGKHLIHSEDRKFLSVGKYSFYPYVTTQNLGSRSEWGLTGFDGKTVVPPPTSLHTFWSGSAGDRLLLYEFSRNPDSALPAGTTRFVTQMPGIDQRDNFLDSVDKWTGKEVGKTSKWLARNNAAWLFMDGFCAVANKPNQLEVRKLDGTPVWRATIDPATRQIRSQRVGTLASNYRVPALTWDRIKADETRNRQLQYLLKTRYDLRG
ncbi:enterotoxin A family protein [Paraburkholderia xenovorans]|jgi:hypothetical protein